MDRTLTGHAATAVSAATRTVTVEHWEYLKVQFQHRTSSRLARSRGASRAAAETAGTKGPDAVPA